MKITVRFHESIKDGAGSIHTYDATVDKDVDETGLKPEQAAEKMRAILHYLHREIHQSCLNEQVADGLKSPENVKHPK